MAGLGLSKHVDIQFSIPSYLIPVGALSLCLLAAYQSKGRASSSPDPLIHVAPSPLKTLLPTLSDAEVHGLSYPPDLFPGARDVQTPFGSTRVYEWGPENGRKVLFVHGISTPCMSVGLLAEKLVQNGCRVMIFDLFGRGYSDDPSDQKHDARLYISQILIALASSPLPWTGTNGFSIVGYSLGGGISTAFTDAFPSLVHSLILLCPSGLLRLSHIGWSSKFLYQTEGILPEPLLHYLVRQRLWGGTVSGKPKKSDKADATSAVAAEAGGNPSSTENGRKPISILKAPLFPDRPSVTITSSVRWQVHHHNGFVPAFINSIRNAPITNQHESWKRIGSRLKAQKATGADQNSIDNGLWRNKVLLVLGKTDPIIIASEIGPDATACFGEENIETVLVNGGHDIPTSDTAEVAQAMLNFWKEA